MTGAELAAAARAYLGVPWRHMGRARGGLDCVGLVLAAFRDCGVELRDAAYARGHRGDELVEHVAGQGTRLRTIAEAREGDVLLFTDSLFPCHIGIQAAMNGRPSVVHAKLQRRRVTEDYLDAAGMGGALRAAFRHPALLVREHGGSTETN